MEPFDEAHDAAGVVRPHYAEVLEAVAEAGPAALARTATGRARAAGLAVGATPLPVDPVPRVIPQAEWSPLAEGLAQRAAALDALVAAAYAGEDAPPLLTRSRYFERDLVGAAV